MGLTQRAALQCRAHRNLFVPRTIVYRWRSKLQEFNSKVANEASYHFHDENLSQRPIAPAAELPRR